MTILGTQWVEWWPPSDREDQSSVSFAGGSSREVRGRMGNQTLGFVNGKPELPAVPDLG